ncbi:beta-galactosidase [Paenibacillus sp. Soil787]|uniref:beta-galactosidase n=1 Tax=Paenibacillus sp. Soil787 TaxID=1736411 RepID=UPI0006FCD9A2|nr:beta-galactosidase [Paenibacillus sp. Soil787]KRF43729.1 hypothetical protein ASG93_02090 [Paenibacillus sp. Soil787]
MKVFMANTFRCRPEVRLQVVSEDHFIVETSSDGGGVHLDISHYPQEIWVDYEFMTADVYHESHDVLVIIFTFQEECGRSISVHFGVLPNVQTRVCFPLKALNGEKLFLDRFPGVLQTVLRGDSSVDRNRIDRFSISTIPSVSARRFEVSGLRLTRSKPDFLFEPQPYIDELGQLSWKDWPGKTESSDELERELKAQFHLARERSDACTSDTGLYGGWKEIRFPSTGYFRTEFDGMRWWFVDPDGYALFSTGMDCVGPYSEMRVSGMEHLMPPLPDKDGPFRDAWTPHGYCLAVSNMIRVFGENWREVWTELTEHRLKDWGINTIGNWSQPDFISRSELPYVYPMEGFPSTKETIFRDFPDVYDPEYEWNSADFAKQLISMKEDKRLVGYFMRNEPHWAFVDGLNLTEAMLRNPIPFASKQRFIEWLKEKYETVAGWNTAWEASYQDFRDLLDNGKVEFNDNWVRQQDFALFNRMMIRRYVEIPARFCKEADPHHLNMGMRYAWVANDDILEGCEAFDVFSINCYQFQPDRELIERISKRLERPVMIGEFHFGAADAGMLAYGIRAVTTQEDRGLAYLYYVEQAAVIPELIGVHYFQLNDQPVLGRFDGENYQIGAVDVCQRPYQAFVDQMKLAHRNMYEVRIGRKQPLDQVPMEIPKTGF